MTRALSWLPSLLTFCLPASALLAPEPSPPRPMRPMRHVLTVPELIVKAAPGLEHLALATAWRESRFDPDALHRNRSSVDRGIFQLNSRYYPPMPLAEHIRAGVAAVIRAKRCGSDRDAAWAYVHGHCRGGGR